MSLHPISQDEAELNAPEGLARLERLAKDTMEGLKALEDPRSKAEWDFYVACAMMANRGAVQLRIENLPVKFRKVVEMMLPKVEAPREQRRPKTDSDIVPKTPDGRPYLLKMPGKELLFVATEKGYIKADKVGIIAILQALWPELELFRETDQGVRPYSLTELFGLYGVYVRELYFTYESTTRFDEIRGQRTGDLYLSVATEEPPEPIKHDDVLEWMTLTFGEKTLDWLATLPELDHPTGVLLLLGEAGCGKTMLSHGIARFYGPNLTDYNQVMGTRFNDALLRNPVVVLDEVAEGDSRSGRFRSMFSNGSISVEGKNMPVGTLLGYLRLVIATNSPDPLKLGREELTRADEDAIGIRVIHVDCDAAGREWLRRRGGRQYTAEWVSRENGSKHGKISETIAWLAQNREVRRGARYLVEGDASQWASRIGTRLGEAASVLQAIVNFLDMEPHQRRDAFGDAWPFLFNQPGYESMVLVNPKNLRQHWKTLLGDDAPRNHRTTAAFRTLSGLDKPIRPRLGPLDSQRQRYYPVPVSLLKTLLDEEDRVE